MEQEACKPSEDGNQRREILYLRETDEFKHGILDLCATAYSYFVEKVFVRGYYNEKGQLEAMYKDRYIIVPHTDDAVGVYDGDNIIASVCF